MVVCEAQKICNRFESSLLRPLYWRGGSLLEAARMFLQETGFVCRIRSFEYVRVSVCVSVCVCVSRLTGVRPRLIIVLDEKVTGL